MKTICTFLLVVLSNFSFSQCFVDLGPAIASCPNDTARLGINLVTSGFTAPLTYTWEAHKTWQIGSNTYNFYASDFIDDTTIANPKITSQEEGFIRFKLTVADANGLSCSDSVEVHYSQFVFTLALPMDVFINEGDSVWLSGWQNIAGTVPPFTYLWYPTHGLTDSTSLAFWAKPDTTTLYRLIVTDSLGCSEMGPGSYRVHVNPLNVDENLAAQFSVYPNPTKGKMRIKNTSGLQIEKVSLVDLSGRTVLKITDFKSDELDISLLKSGAYIAQLYTEKGVVQKKLVVC